MNEKINELLNFLFFVFLFLIVYNFIRKEHSGCPYKYDCKLYREHQPLCNREFVDGYCGVQRRRSNETNR